MQTIAPERSPEQRMQALRRANDIRVHRAKTKAGIREGRLDIVDVVLSRDPMLESMRVVELLHALPWFGPVRIRTVTYKCGISPVKTLGGLSDRQRDELLIELGTWLARRGVAA